MLHGEYLFDFEQKLSKRMPPPASFAIELYFRVYDHLSPIDVVAASQTSKVWYTASQQYFANSLWLLLLRYFDREEADELRLLQAELGAIISGSSAIQFFQRFFISDSDLDIYVEHNHALRLGCFLQRIGYRPIPNEIPAEGLQDNNTATPSSFEEMYSLSLELLQDTPHGPHHFPLHGRYSDYTSLVIAAVFNFQRGEKIVQIITTKGPVLQLIFSFHSTVPMNIITHSHAYSLYPKATFKEMRGLNICCLSNKQLSEAAREKYRQRGWKLLEAMNSDISIHEATPPDKFEFAPGRRWVGDSKCMTIVLPPVDLKYLPLSTTSWISNSWSLEFRRNAGAIIDCSVFVGDNWKYCVADDDLMNIMEIPDIAKLAKKFRCSTDIVFEVVAAKYKAQQLTMTQKGLISFFEQSYISAALLTDLFERVQI